MFTKTYMYGLPKQQQTAFSTMRAVVYMVHASVVLRETCSS